ncbi:MAG: response regulator [Candidatus Komeilibacteria bacterium]
MRNKTKKILITEDETLLRNALGEKLRLEGFEVLAAENGQKGLELALAEHPDLILLDIIMPVMDGLTMLKQLRQDAWGKTAPVILLTNLTANDNIMPEVIEQQPAFYLVKTDWTLDKVVEKIKETLKID